MFIRPFLKMVYIEIKLMYQREPMGAMVAFIIPLFFFLIIMEGILPMPVCVNHLLPSIVVLAVVANAFFALPTSIATHREIKYFTQLKATPMTPLTLLFAMGIASFVMTVLGILALITVATPMTSLSLLSSLGIANFVMTMLGILTLLAVGIFLYDAEFGGQILTFSAGFILIVLCITSIGILIASLCRTTKAAEGVGMLFSFTLMFFSEPLHTPQAAARLGRRLSGPTSAGKLCGRADPRTVAGGPTV
ncbi:hypothetical protein M1O50_04025 [Dehalococcoidia bacterium]|nr:hypothetical protein [Dehalococcoidia bacterium]